MAVNILSSVVHISVQMLTRLFWQASYVMFHCRCGHLPCKHWTRLNSIPPESIMPPLTLIYVFFFLLLAVIDKAIWGCLAFHHLGGCQWLGIKILYIGLIFPEVCLFYHMTFTLLPVRQHSCSLSRGVSPSPRLYVIAYLFHGPQKPIYFSHSGLWSVKITPYSAFIVTDALLSLTSPPPSS